jgi:Tfp pilus assembly protein PilN
VAREDIIETTAAERRLGFTLMWMGVLMGALFIAVVGMGFSIMSTYGANGPISTLTRENASLAAKLDIATKSLAASEQTVRDQKAEIEKLKAPRPRTTTTTRPREPTDPFR